MKKNKTSKAPDAYASAITAATGTPCVAEHRFHPVRRWRFDYALPEAKVAIEIDGGLWTYGRHNRAAGYIADMEKLNAATLLGWRVLRFTPRQQWTTEAIDTIARAVAEHPGQRCLASSGKTKDH